MCPRNLKGAQVSEPFNQSVAYRNVSAVERRERMNLGSWWRHESPTMSVFLLRIGLARSADYLYSIVLGKSTISSSCQSEYSLICRKENVVGPSNSHGLLYDEVLGEVSECDRLIADSIISHSE